MKKNLVCLFLAAVLWGAACTTPEERAKGDKGGGKDDSIKNSPPPQDYHVDSAEINNRDTSNRPAQ